MFVFGFCSTFLLNEGTAIVLKQSFLKLGGHVRFSLNKGTDGGAIAVTESSVVRKSKSAASWTQASTQASPYRNRGISIVS